MDNNLYSINDISVFKNYSFKEIYWKFSIEFNSKRNTLTLY